MPAVVAFRVRNDRSGGSAAAVVVVPPPITGTFFATRRRRVPSRSAVRKTAALLGPPELVALTIAFGSDKWECSSEEKECNRETSNDSHNFNGQD